APAPRRAAAGTLTGPGPEPRVPLSVADPGLQLVVEQAGEPLLRELLIVSQFDVVWGAPPGRAPTGDRVVVTATSLPGLAVEVRHADGQKCGRCWTWSPAVGRDPEHPA